MIESVNSTSVLNRDRPVKLLVLGGGYSGRRLAALAARAGIAGVISHRDPSAAAAPPPGWHKVGFDSGSGLRPDPAALTDITHVVSTIAPDREGHDPVLSQMGDLLQTLRPQWLGYLSTTGVYGDSGGASAAAIHAASPVAQRQKLEESRGPSALALARASPLRSKSSN